MAVPPTWVPAAFVLPEVKEKTPEVPVGLTPEV